MAAAVREFSHAIDHLNGVFGIAQWFAGRGHEVALGPSEADLVDAYADCAGTMPDYPAVQVAAGAIIAASLSGESGMRWQHTRRVKAGTG